MQRRRGDANRGRGLVARLGLAGAVALLAVASAASGESGQDDTPPRIEVAKATAVRLSAPAGAYVLRLTFAARDSSGLVWYRVAVRCKGAFLASKLGRTKSGLASAVLRVRVPGGVRDVRVVITASDMTGNESSLARELRLPSAARANTRQRRNT